VLIEHPAVAKASYSAGGHQPTAETAAAILNNCLDRLAPFKRIRRIEFAELQTISGKIRWVELRVSEQGRESRNPGEFWEEGLG
jgi:acetyl-CoA synthetase